MKTTIIDLLNKIANGEEPPRRIHYKGNTYIYNKEEKDYESEDFVEYLFDSHIITDILNDEVEILETTITYNGDQIRSMATNKIEKLTYKNTFDNNSNMEVQEVLADKINEIIEAINEK